MSNPTTARLFGIVAFQRTAIEVAEGVIDRKGLLPQYRRVLAARIRKDIEHGEDHPADLVRQCYEAAGCQGPPPRVADHKLPIDEWAEEEV